MRTAPSGDRSTASSVMPALRPVVIVGAGSAGLAAAAALERLDIPAVVLERGPSVASSWRLRHEELHLNTIRRLSDLPGLCMPRSIGRWVARDDYVNYLERFAAHQRLRLQLGVHVRRLDRDGASGGWRVVTSTDDHATDHVIVATGYDRVPFLPDWPGRDSFPKPVIHVIEHRRAPDLAGRRVLLVGAGNSRVELAGHLVDAGVAALWVSVRNPPNILPREFAGLPLHPFTVSGRILPEPLRDAIARFLARLAFGDLARYGLPPRGRAHTSGCAPRASPSQSTRASSATSGLGVWRSSPR